MTRWDLKKAVHKQMVANHKKLKQGSKEESKMSPQHADTVIQKLLLNAAKGGCSER